MADPNGITFGLDVSHHQTGVDVGKLKAAGAEFIIARTAQAKGGKYGTTIDRYYAEHKANALRAGQLFSSYFYVGNGITPEANVALHASVEPDRKVPVMLDVEEGSGNIAFYRQVLAAFRAAGYYVWGSYIPRWYWQAQGSEDLRNLPPLVSSRYADMVQGSIASEYASTPESYWANYGNNVVALLQFTSSGRINPYPNVNLDLNAFRGTRDQVAQLFDPGYQPPTPDIPQEGIDIMTTLTVPAAPDGGTYRIRKLPGGPNAKLIVRPGGVDNSGFTATPVTLNYVWAWGSDKGGVGHNPISTPNYDVTIEADREMPLPGALWADFGYKSTVDFEIDCVG
jgi:hypothetical protein